MEQDQQAEQDQQVQQVSSSRQLLLAAVAVAPASQGKLDAPVEACMYCVVIAEV